MPKTLSDLLHSFRGKEALALRDHRSDLAYGELYCRALALAVHYRSLGIQPHDTLVFFADKTVDVFPHIFACFLCGAAFCPLDRSLPAERLCGMLDDLRPAAIVAQQRALDEVRARLQDEVALPATVFVIDDPAPPLVGTEFILPPVDGNAIAYVIFTSGSTGRPKGVQISHTNLLAFLQAFGDRYGRGENYRYLSVGPLFFDMTVLDCLVPLAYGATTFLYSGLCIPSLFAAVIEAQRINCFSAVPSTLARLFEPGSLPALAPKLVSLKLILLGAEAFTGELVRRLFAAVPEVRIINAYGPTECSVCCFSHEITKEDSGGECFAVGRPFPGVDYLLRSTAGKYSRTGTGTLLIGGPQVMHGYARRAQENDARLLLIDGQRFYDSGDIIYVDEHSCAWFKGRDDEEIKLNGFRVHLSDVSSHLAALLPGEVTLLLKVEIHGEECLALSHASPAIDARAVYEQLKLRIPGWMLPRIWIRFDAIVYLANGKIDRKAMQRRLNDEMRILAADSPERQLLYTREAASAQLFVDRRPVPPAATLAHS